MPKKKTALATIALVVLTIAVVDSLYWLCFSVWMTAYPFADHNHWRINSYLWLAATLLIGAVWFGFAVYLFRRNRPSV